MAVTPRHVLCMLGNWRDFDAVEALVAQVGGGFELDLDYSQTEPDERMTSAFEASYDRVAPTMTKADWQAVREHSAVAYVISPPLTRKCALELSGRALLLTAALLRAGGVAAKGESAGIAHGRERWLALAGGFVKAAKKEDQHAVGASLHSAWVRRPLLDEDERVYYSCGMHLLGMKDIEIDAALEVDDAIEWIDLLGLYLVADRPERRIASGSGFRLSDDGPRRVMQLRPCERYEQDDFLFNPYGYFRLE